MTHAALLLAGGIGTRLRPLSSDARPKQFLRLFDGESLLRKTWRRVRDLEVFVSTNERYRDLVLEEIPELEADRVITEPARRNTAPALALSCFEIASRLGDDVAIACLPADHYIENEAEFRRVLDIAFAHSDSLVTIAITPTEPNTEYGYLELGNEIEPDAIEVRRFVEKPDARRAEEFLRAGNYAWNAGMFVWRADVFRRELERHAPDVARVTRERYEDAPSISIDYALMEKATNVVAVRGNFGWSDVGSWDALRRIVPGVTTSS
jgi:mannose-1-phosphate guanylyltransferase/mannose-6-phosphate isomerase